MRDRRRASVSKRWKGASRTCWCLKKFTPKTPGQKHCCTRHERIWTRAHQGKWGTDLIEKDPAYALVWYSYIR